MVTCNLDLVMTSLLPV